MQHGLIIASGYSMKRMHGYTLVELAIVLMVIALLVGAVLKWQDMGDSQKRPIPAQAK